MLPDREPFAPRTDCDEDRGFRSRPSSGPRCFPDATDRADCAGSGRLPWTSLRSGGCWRHDRLAAGFDVFLGEQA
jgi:hypothetical protein